MTTGFLATDGAYYSFYPNLRQLPTPDTYRQNNFSNTLPHLNMIARGGVYRTAEMKEGHHQAHYATFRKVVLHRLATTICNREGNTVCPADIGGISLPDLMDPVKFKETISNFLGRFWHFLHVAGETSSVIVATYLMIHLVSVVITYGLNVYRLWGIHGFNSQIFCKAQTSTLVRDLYEENISQQILTQYQPSTRQGTLEEIGDYELNIYPNVPSMFQPENL